MNLYSSFIQNWENVETNKMSFNKWKCKQTGAEIKKEMRYKTMKKKGKTLSLYCWVKKVISEKVSAVWFQLYDFLEKVEL